MSVCLRSQPSCHASLKFAGYSNLLNGDILKMSNLKLFQPGVSLILLTELGFCTYFSCALRSWQCWIRHLLLSSTTNIFDLSRMISKSGHISSPMIMLGELKFVTFAYNSRANCSRKVVI